MWQAAEGLFIIVFVMLLFGIFSLPLPSKKRIGYDVQTSIPKEAVSVREMPDASVALKEAALGKEQSALGKAPLSNSADQKSSPDALTPQRGYKN
jgi:hypothetical protein